MQIGMQLIFLIATLLPKDEEEFFKAMCTSQECVQMFYGPTTYQNIQYQVYEADRDTIQAICKLVKKKLEQYLVLGKIVVYGGSVEQTIEIGKALRCPIYYHGIDDQAGKVRCVKELIEGRSQVIVTTNALGLGVDLPDI